MAVQATLASIAFQNIQVRDSAGLKKRAGTGCAAIDEALRGGFDFGQISCLSGGNNGACGTILLQTISEHLLASGDAHVAVIDTSGSFEVIGLHQVLSAEVTRRTTTDQVEGEFSSAEDCLERVKLMRVFDFVGLTEAINELKESLEKPNHCQVSPPLSSTKSLIVPDSEDEDDGLLSIGSPIEVIQRPKDASQGKLISPLTWILVIDNLSNVIQPILKSNYIQGQALCTTFLRSLTHLSRDHSMCTILVNNVITSKERSRKESAGDDQGGSPHREQSNNFGGSSVLEQPSIFASNSIRPALGKTLAFWVDLHILLSVLPLKKRDAHMMYGSYPDHIQQRANVAHVAEVLTDRYDGRVGRWAAFHIVEGTTLNGIP